MGKRKGKRARHAPSSMPPPHTSNDGRWLRPDRTEHHSENFRRLCWMLVRVVRVSPGVAEFFGQLPGLWKDEYDAGLVIDLTRMSRPWERGRTQKRIPSGFNIWHLTTRSELEQFFEVCSALAEGKVERLAERLEREEEAADSAAEWPRLHEGDRGAQKWLDEIERTVKSSEVTEVPFVPRSFRQLDTDSKALALSLVATVTGWKRSSLQLQQVSGSKQPYVSKLLKRADKMIQEEVERLTLLEQIGRDVRDIKQVTLDTQRDVREGLRVAQEQAMLQEAIYNMLAGRLGYSREEVEIMVNEFIAST